MIDVLNWRLEAVNKPNRQTRWLVNLWQIVAFVEITNASDFPLYRYFLKAILISKQTNCLNDPPTTP